MPSTYETFWDHAAFAVVGHSATKPFPALTYGGLKKIGKKVFAIDSSSNVAAGDKAYPDFGSLPEHVDAAVIEVPRDLTESWVRKAADAGIQNVWLHMNSDTAQAVALAKERSIDLRTGTCAVMYVTQGFTYHSIHGWVQKLRGAY
ncbi:MAG: CoA-binding protein [Polyangiaceae bacterium]|jgi:predicted CoA-binding protein